VDGVVAGQFGREWHQLAVGHRQAVDQDQRRGGIGPGERGAVMGVYSSDGPPAALKSPGRMGGASRQPIPAQGRSESPSDSGHLLNNDGDPPRPLSMSCCAAQLRTQPLAVTWGRQARAVSQPRRNLVLLGVLAQGGDQLVLAHRGAAIDLQLTGTVT